MYQIIVALYGVLPHLEASCSKVKIKKNKHNAMSDIIELAEQFYQYSMLLPSKRVNGEKNTDILEFFKWRGPNSSTHSQQGLDKVGAASATFSLSHSPLGMLSCGLTRAAFVRHRSVTEYEHAYERVCACLFPNLSLMHQFVCMRPCICVRAPSPHLLVYELLSHCTGLNPAGRPDSTEEKARLMSVLTLLHCSWKVGRLEVVVRGGGVKRAWREPMMMVVVVIDVSLEGTC